MANDKQNVDRWVDARLASLEGVHGFRPDLARAMAQLRQRDRAGRLASRRWMWTAAAAAVVAAGVLALPASCSAASPATCRQPLAGRLWESMFQSKVAAVPVRKPEPAVLPVPAAAPPQPAAPAPAAPAKAKAPVRAQAPVVNVLNFKESGAPSAPLTCEVYTDYECPACAALYEQVIPLLEQQYVQTGKMKLLHRDYPLAMHPYSKLAARYANAAGRMGHYEAAVQQIFRTQNLWRQDGGIDAQLALVLPEAAMERVRKMVKEDPGLDETVTADMAMGTSDQIHQTPTLVIVSKGKRQAIAPMPPYPLLKQYLDRLLQ